MGRLATHIAAGATDVEDLPASLPMVSVIDALLPSRLNSAVKPLGFNASVRSTSGDSEIKRDKKGRLVIIRHRGTSNHPGSIAENGKDSERLAPGDPKRNFKSVHSRGTGKNAKRIDESGATGWGDAKKGDFTPEEDAKLKELKALTGREGKSWAEIAQEMGRQKGEVQARYKIIKDEPDGSTRGKSDESKAEGGKEKRQDDQQKNQDEDGNKHCGKTSKDNNQQKKGGAGRKDRVWTAEDDAKLKELYAANTSWKDMPKELKRSQAAIKARWEEIGRHCNDFKRKDSSSQKPKSNPEANEVDEKNDRKKGAKPASVVSKAHSHRSGAKFTMSEWMTLQEDDLFSFQELRLLSHLIMRDSNQSWLRIASAFHDKTGRRVHPDDIRDKFGVLATMG